MSVVKNMPDAGAVHGELTVYIVTEKVTGRFVEVCLIKKEATKFVEKHGPDFMSTAYLCCA